MASSASLGCADAIPVPCVAQGQRFPNFSKRDPNLSLVNSSLPKPQIAFEKIMIVWMVLAISF